MKFHPLPPERFKWAIWARWWDCERDSIHYGNNLPGFPDQEWSHVDLYEIEETFITSTADHAEALFRFAYPWIDVFHTSLVGPVLPKLPKPRRPKSSRIPVTHAP